MPSALELPEAIDSSARPLSEPIDRSADAALRAAPATWPSAWSRYVLQPAIIGLGLTLAQVLFVTLLAGRGSLAEGYRSLCCWDGRHYEDIATQGYHSTVPPTIATHPDDLHASNVAFFPGYPLVAGIVGRATGWPPAIALLVTSQAAAWGFWASLWWFFARWKVAPRVAVLATAAVLAHPAAFYLVVAYSESLFLVATMVFLFFSSTRLPSRSWLAVPWGVLMTATRLAGLPLAACPVIAACFADQSRRQRAHNALQAALVAVAASLGGLGFLAYCQWRFGAWNLYFETQRLGWHVGADPWWLLRPSSYTFWASLTYDNVVWPDDLSRLFVPVTLLATGGIALWEIRAARSNSTHWRERIVFYLAAWVIFGLHAMGVSPILMKSLFRYSLGANVLALLGVVHAITLDDMGPSLRRRELILLGATAVAMLSLQAALAWRFTHLLWVA